MQIQLSTMQILANLVDTYLLNEAYHTFKQLSESTFRAKNGEYLQVRFQKVSHFVLLGQINLSTSHGIVKFFVNL